MSLPKVKMFWDNCTKCKIKLKTAKEKKQGRCSICELKQKLNSYWHLAERID